MQLASFPDLSVAEYISSYEPGTLNKAPGTLFALCWEKIVKCL